MTHMVNWIRQLHDPRVWFVQTLSSTMINKIKKWNHAWKIRLIEEMNPEWRDLFDDLLEGF